jgi:hypothetical protein
LPRFPATALIGSLNPFVLKFDGFVKYFLRVHQIWVFKAEESKGNNGITEVGFPP